MNPSLTIALVFAASLALVLGHAIRMGWMAYRASCEDRPVESDKQKAHPDRSTDRTSDPRQTGHGEIKPMPGSAVGAALPGGPNARTTIAEPKPTSTIKTS